MVLGTLSVGEQQCGLKGSGFPLNVAVAKLGQDLVDFVPGNRYAPLVEVKAKKARELIAGSGNSRACAAMQEVLMRFLPDVYRR